MLIVDGIQYLVEKEVSKNYGLSRHWFRKARWAKNGPPYHKLNGKVFYKESEINEWFNNHLTHYE